MTEQEAITNLIVVMNFDKRLQVHTLKEVEPNVFKHTNNCPRCCGLYVLGIESDWIDPIVIHS
jgi:hypothetical protein